MPTPSLTPEEGLAAALKLLAAFPVLRWPLVGAGIAIAADALDVVVMNYVDLGGGGIRHYHAFDKWTDLFALGTFFAVALRWSGRDRTIAVVLFALRLLGVVLFETLHWRAALILLPNLFETWFLYVLLRNAIRPGEPGRERPGLLVGLVAFKVLQEIAIHGYRVLDRYVLADVIRGLFR